MGRGLKLRTLDYVKRALGDMEREASKNAPDDARIIGGLRRSLTNALDNADVTGRAGPNSLKPEGGMYAQARSLAADKFSQKRAIDAGLNFMRGSEFRNPQELARSVEGMGQQERHLFRVGAAQAIKERLGGLVARADATKKIKDIPALEQKILLAFGDDKTFSKYIDMLNSERQMFDTYGAIRGGSQTAERLAADADTAVDPGALAAAGVDLASNPWNPMAWLRGAKAVSGRAAAQAKTPEPVRRELAKILMGQDTTPLNSQMQAQVTSEAQKRNLTRLLTQGAIVTGPRN